MEQVTLSIKNRLAYITLNRPEKRNALNSEMVSALLEKLEVARQSADTKIVILRANGDAFCAGADLAYLKSMQTATFEENLADSLHLKNLFQTIYEFPKVVIAQVEGHAIAGGAGLATVCDFVFAVPDAKLAYTEVRIGFVPAIVSVFLLRKIGEARAKELLFTGKLISMQEAHSQGLINEIVEQEDIAETVEKFAQKLAKTASGDSLRLTKQLLIDVQSMNHQTAFEHAARVNAQARSTPDCQKGIAAFLKKEPISF